jgi:hypothetical protein
VNEDNIFTKHLLRKGERMREGATVYSDVFVQAVICILSGDEAQLSDILKTGPRICSGWVGMRHAAEVRALLAAAYKEHKSDHEANRLELHNIVGGETLLMIAAMSPHPKRCAIASQLLHAGADANQQKPFGEDTALHIAARRGDRDLVEILYDATDKGLHNSFQQSVVQARLSVGRAPEQEPARSVKPGLFAFGQRQMEMALRIV